MPSLLDNSPWWMPGVTMAGAGSGVLVQRCNPFGGTSPRHLEGGFYGLAHLGPHLWECHARAEGRYRYRCRCGHRSREPQWLCPGHVYMMRKRMSGVCPPCVHPPREVEIQTGMQAIRDTAHLHPTLPALDAAYTRLWDLQHELDELVERGIVHRCPLVLEEVS